MKIGELARKAGLNAQTIRYYEREGILPEPRRRYDSGYREYDEDALYRLLFIKQAKNAGFKLSDVKQLFDLELLPEEACIDVGKVLSDRIKELEEKIRELKAFSKSLKKLKQTCDESENGRCAVLDSLRNCAESLCHWSWRARAERRSTGESRPPTGRPGHRRRRWS